MVVAAVGAKYHNVEHECPEKSDMEKSDMVGLCKSFLAACEQRTDAALALAGMWRSALHAAYAAAIEHYPDAEAAWFAFMNHVGAALTPPDASGKHTIMESHNMTQLRKAFYTVLPKRARLSSTFL